LVNITNSKGSGIVRGKLVPPAIPCRVYLHLRKGYQPLV